MTVGCPPSITATTELVVPRSMPMIFPMLVDALLVIMPIRWIARRISTTPLSTLSLLLSSFLLGAVEASAAPLYVAAAADLSPMQSALSESIANATGIQVEFTFGSSGMLARQIEN